MGMSYVSYKKKVERVEKEKWKGLNTIQSGEVIYKLNKN